MNADSWISGLRTVSTIVISGAPIVGGGVPTAIVEGVGEGLMLVADLVALGKHPREAIVRMRSSLADFAATVTSLERYAETGQ
jgi:hypothetical protein